MTYTAIPLAGDSDSDLRRYADQYADTEYATGDPSATNSRSAGRAARVLIGYPGSGSGEERITDLIADLLHLADAVEARGVDVVATATRRYEEELEGDF
ncbi:Uncharacterised protein (plasmid) [Tsukamurella tyrosinosolvens]|uniref:Uncharacterized protein n=1 Tax=Tsukamurella tyrosinosolvens TaxID=57704 RepID=A0A1H4V8M3_TSUTY|nr:hypothetical protein [Tsukamurella tyrosinosolvens]KXO91023.1 hypothetical protein AXK58_21575 [Tsukamurella tyrosinosolvens]SEC77327.1 hypothetical protein SAMN04489793_3174 [Tsukamurella tyrosinosolvens]VEH90625.1 Uncharacterised protein [Tsukamurella tyrosinosolvens]